MDSMIPQEKAESLIKKYGIPFAETVPARSALSAARAADRLGYPVAMKIVSKDIIHKTDSGGIALGLGSGKEVENAYNGMIRTVRKRDPKARISGVLMQRMHPGREVIIGARRDPQFGPVVMFGLGGVFVEVMKDVSFRLAPLESRDAAGMIREIKGYPVLKGVRGDRPVNFASLERCILAVSELIWKESPVKEMDLNPVMVDGRGAIAVDVRMMG